VKPLLTKPTRETKPTKQLKSTMKKRVLLGIVWAWVFFGSGPPARAEEVPYTLEDRDRLIRVETILQEFKESVDKRIESVDKRINGVDKRIERLETVMMGGFGLLFTSMIGLVGFVLWDRRTALAPAIRKSRELEEREERIERALRELAQQDPRVAEALKHAGLL